MPRQLLLRACFHNLERYTINNEHEIKQKIHTALVYNEKNKTVRARKPRKHYATYQKTRYQRWKSFVQYKPQYKLHLCHLDCLGWLCLRYDHQHCRCKVELNQYFNWLWAQGRLTPSNRCKTSPSEDQR